MTMTLPKTQEVRSKLPAHLVLNNMIPPMQAPLVHAILAGNIEEVEQILEQDPEAVSSLDTEKRSPLHAAAFMGYAEIVELLITKGNARVNSKDNQWLTPLHRACRASAEVFISNRSSSLNLIFYRYLGCRVCATQTQCR